jgi:hypothetical protein
MVHLVFNVHGKVVKSFKEKPPECAFLGVGSDGVLSSACLTSSEESWRDHQPQVDGSSLSPP